MERGHYPKKKKQSMHQHRDCMQVSCFLLKVKKLKNQAKIHLNAQSIIQELEAAALPSPWSKATAPFSPVPQFPPQKALAAPGSFHEPQIHPPCSTRAPFLPPNGVGSELSPRTSPLLFILSPAPVCRVRSCSFSGQGQVSMLKCSGGWSKKKIKLKK